MYFTTCLILRLVSVFSEQILVIHIQSLALKILLILNYLKYSETFPFLKISLFSKLSKIFPFPPAQWKAFLLITLLEFRKFKEKTFIRKCYFNKVGSLWFYQNNISTQIFLWKIFNILGLLS